jgi:hypothetical protein
VVAVVDLGQVGELRVGEVVDRPEETAVARFRAKPSEALRERLAVVGLDRPDEDVLAVAQALLPAGHAATVAAQASSSAPASGAATGGSRSGGAIRSTSSFTRSKTDSARFRCSRSCVAITDVRSSAPPRWTAG